MRAERQQGGWYRRRPFADDREPSRHGQGGEDGIQPARSEESQPLTASDQIRALANNERKHQEKPPDTQSTSGGGGGRRG